MQSLFEAGRAVGEHACGILPLHIMWVCSVHMVTGG
jgi:hypothetical protein